MPSSGGPSGVSLSPITPATSPISPTVPPHHQPYFAYNNSSQQPFLSRTTRPQLSTDSLTLPPPVPGFAPSSLQSPYGYTQNTHFDGPLPPIQASSYDGQHLHSQSYRSYNTPFTTGFAQSIQISPEEDDQNAVAFLGDYPITEASKVTGDLVGASFCQSATLDYKGEKVLMFVFSVRDLLLLLYLFPSMSSHFLTSVEGPGHNSGDNIAVGVVSHIRHVLFHATPFCLPSTQRRY